VSAGEHLEGIVLNLGGEGELVGAIDVNSLDFPLRSEEHFVIPGQFVQGRIEALPIRSNAALSAVGTRLPMQTAEDRARTAAEALRVLVPGGIVRLHASSGGGLLWVPILIEAGAMSVTIEGIYAVGVKP
jgi:hypothetical protein